MGAVAKLMAIAAALALLSGCAGDPPRPPGAGAEATVLLLLHAETDPVYMDRLSERGLARSDALPDAVAGYAVSAIYYTSFRRNYQTIDPLARRLGLAPRPMPVHRKFYGAYEARSLVDQLLTQHAGQTVLWVGTDDSVKPLYEALQGSVRPPVGPGEVVALTLSEGRETTEHRFRFGD